MARIKYATDIDPLLNKHFGFTFQPNHYGQSMFPASRSARFRRPRQHNRQQNNQKAVTQWRNMTPETKAAWDLFASTYVQSTKRGVGTYLTGYQLFIKRNSYCFLNHGITSDFMLEPAMEAIEAGTTIFTLEAGDNTIDLTELYISNFGIIPTVGQTLLFCAIPYSDVSGQFFPPIFDKLEVQEVFIDGFFLSLNLPANMSNILFSVYLSKPVSAGQRYVGTKVRYMGCFTSKTFLGLTDTPGSYAGQASKAVAVKADESGLEFVTPGGGGLTCEDLPACPEIIDIWSQLAAIGAIVSVDQNISIPPISFGLLYNAYSFLVGASFFRTSWALPTEGQITSLSTYLGGNDLSGGKLKETGLVYWQSPNTGATNEKGFNARGSGVRSNSTGAFTGLKQQRQFWTSTIPYSNNHKIVLLSYANDNLVIATGPDESGRPICLCRTAIGAADGVIGSYVGFNGRIYRTIAINQMEWLADSLAETKRSDGSSIPEITINATWIADRAGALCAYENNWNNV